MARRLNATDKSFAADFEALLFAKREIEEDVALAVRGLIADVRARGDAALVELTNKFDRASIIGRGPEVLRRRDRSRAGQGHGGAEGRHRNRRQRGSRPITGANCPKDEQLSGRHRRHPGLALDGGGQRGTLCARRHRQPIPPRC